MRTMAGWRESTRGARSWAELAGHGDQIHQACRGVDRRAGRLTFDQSRSAKIPFWCEILSWIDRDAQAAARGDCSHSDDVARRLLRERDAVDRRRERRLSVRAAFHYTFYEWNKDAKNWQPSETGTISREGDHYVQLADLSTSDKGDPFLLKSIGDNYYIAQQPNNSSFIYDLVRVNGNIIYQYGMACTDEGPEVRRTGPARFIHRRSRLAETSRVVSSLEKVGRLFSCDCRRAPATPKACSDAVARSEQRSANRALPARPLYFAARCEKFGWIVLVTSSSGRGWASPANNPTRMDREQAAQFWKVNRFAQMG